jgi:hypothetical protein
MLLLKIIIYFSFYFILILTLAHDYPEHSIFNRAGGIFGIPVITGT